MRLRHTKKFVCEHGLSFYAWIYRFRKHKQREYGQKVFFSRITAISRTMVSGYAFNVETFRTNAWETEELFVAEYPWFYTLLSIHKILIRGADISDNFSLPIGTVPEEALEAKTKDFPNYRRNHLPKTSRLHTMYDRMHTLLVSSDPLISTESRRITKYSTKYVQIDDDVKLLLL